MRITADAVTILGFGIGCLCFVALYFQAYSAALFLLILNRLCDGLDGPIARQTKASDLGGYLDIVSDFIFYAGFIFFFALGQPDTGLAASYMLFGFMGSASSFLAYAIIAAKRGQNHEKQGRKSFYYLKGITEGTETVISFVIICLFPAAFTAICWIYGTLCLITAFGRSQQAVLDFKD